LLLLFWNMRMRLEDLRHYSLSSVIEIVL